MIIKQIKGNEQYYIGEDGSVFKKLKPWKTSSGYYHVKLAGKHYDVHRLVASEFINNTNNLPVVNHIDEDKENNHYTNLEWCTQKDNVQKYITNGGTPIKNFVNCKLYRGEELIAECESIMEASRIAEQYGCSITSINKYKKNKGFKIVKG